MESPQNIKKRLKSVKNINQITRAMELVAATKMRKSQQVALDSRPYAFSALHLLANISKIGGELPELLKKRKIKHTIYVLMASDKGLAGAFNSSLFRKFENSIKNENSFFLAIGEKSSAYLERKGIKAIKKFTNVGDYVETNQVSPISEFLISGYLKKEWDSVIVFSTHFRSALKQEPMIREILPIRFNGIKKLIEEIIPEKGKFAELIKERNLNFLPDKIQEYIIEPSKEKVLDSLAKHMIFMQIYHLILEANASEHAARRMAMKTASDNASKLSFDLNLKYNKSRQSAITKELSEISAGAEALNN